MEKKIYHIKFPDGSIYKGDYDTFSNNVFNNFGCLNKNNEYYLSQNADLHNNYMSYNNPQNTLKSKIIFYTNFEEDPKKIGKNLNETICSNINDKKSYINPNFKTNLLIITDKTSDNCKGHVSDASNKLYIFEKFLEWNLNFNPEYSQKQSIIKGNFSSIFEEIKEFHVVEDIKKKISSEVMKLFQNKVDSILNFLNNCEILIEKLCKDLFLSYMEIKKFSLIFEKNEKLNIKSKELNLLKMKNEFFSLFSDFDKNNEDLNFNDRESMNTFNNKNKSIHDHLYNLVKGIDLQIKNEISQIQLISLSETEKNLKKLENFQVNIENGLNEFIFYSEFLEFISKEEFITKINIDIEITKKLRLNAFEKSLSIEKDNNNYENLSSIYFSNIFIILNLKSDFQGNLFSFQSSFGIQNVKLFLQNESFESQLDQHCDGNMIKLIFIYKFFSIRDDILRFLIDKNSDKSNLNNQEQKLRNLNKIFYELTFSNEIKTLRKLNGEFTVQFNYCCELNIYEILDFDEDIINTNIIDKNKIKNENLVLITSKLIVLKHFNLKFKNEIIKIFNDNDTKTKTKINVKDFCCIYNDCINIDKETETIFHEIFINKKELTGNKHTKISSVMDLLDRITKKEIIITKLDTNLSFTHYNNEIFKTKRKKEQNENSNTFDMYKNKDSDFITNKENFIFNYNLEIRKIFFGEIIKNRKFESKNYLMEKYIHYPDMSENKMKNDLNNYKFDMENNLLNILNKNKTPQLEFDNEKDERFKKEFCKNGFGFEIYDFYQNFCTNSIESNEVTDLERNKDFNFYLGYFTFNKFDKQGFFNNKNFMFFGEYSDSYKDGFGFLYFKLENDVYVGELKKNFLMGKGFYLYNENQVIKFYFGRFHENQSDGKGEIVFNNSDYYYGCFKDNIKIIEGAYLKTNKNCFYIKYIFDKKGNEIIDSTSYHY